MHLRSVDLNLLVALDALLQESSVTKAAERIGLSTPAMSHALARLRDQLEDPVLVRAGRGMVPSPRADALRAKVRSLLEDVELVLTPEHELDLSTLRESFRIHATDYVLFTMGLAVDRIAHREAPSVQLSFFPNVSEDPALLREGSLHLAVGVYQGLPPEIRIRKLFDERLVSVVRTDHPVIKTRLTLKQYTELAHIQVAPRGRPGGLVDRLLEEKGKARHIARTMPYFQTALIMVSQTDYLLTVPERVALAAAASMPIRILKPPLTLSRYPMSLIWHPRHDKDPAHEWLRRVFVRAASSIPPLGDTWTGDDPTDSS